MMHYIHLSHMTLKEWLDEAAGRASQPAAPMVLSTPRFCVGDELSQIYKPAEKQPLV